MSFGWCIRLIGVSGGGCRSLATKRRVIGKRNHVKEPKLAGFLKLFKMQPAAWMFRKGGDPVILDSAQQVQNETIRLFVLSKKLIT